MGSFYDLTDEDLYPSGLDPTAGQESDPTALGPQPSEGKFNLDAETGARVLASPALKPAPSVTGLLDNAYHDAVGLAQGVSQLAGHVLYHPVQTAEEIGGAVAHPIDTAEKLAQPFVEKYTPQEGESIPGMLARVAYDHPLDTLMDAAAVIGGPAAALEDGARAVGAESLAATARAVGERAALLDPITQAGKLGMMALDKTVPDVASYIRGASAAADASSMQTKAARYAEANLNRRFTGEGGVFENLNDAERNVFFPYVEGRLQVPPDGAPLQEFTYRGKWENVPADSTKISKANLDEAATRYAAVQEEYDRIRGLMPDQVVQRASEAFMRDAEKAGRDLNDPALAAEHQQALQEAYAESMQQYDMRRTVSTRTALDVAKRRDFEAAQAAAEASNAGERAIEASRVPPLTATTPEEALAYIDTHGTAPTAGVLSFPHNGDVYTREQSTVANLLSKFREASTYANNSGAVFASGALEHMNPVKALIRTFMQLDQGANMPLAARAWGEKLVSEGAAERISREAYDPLDPRLVNGTHQLVHPALLHVEGMQTDEGRQLLTKLFEQSSDPAVRDLNVADIMDRIGDQGAKTLMEHINDDMYIVPKGAGDALAAWKRSFEPDTNPISRILGETMGPINYSNLTLPMGRRILHYTVSDLMFAGMQGVHPFSIRGVQSLIDTGRALAAKAGILRDPESMRLAGVFELPGIARGADLTGTDLMGSSTVGTAERLQRSSSPVLRGIGNVGAFVDRTPIGMISRATQRALANIDDAFRGASMFYAMRDGAAADARKLVTSAGNMMTLGERVSQLRDMGVQALGEPDVQYGLKQVEHFIGDHDRMTALERNFVRRIFPYEKFYTHAASFLFHQPFEAPAKTALVRSLAAAAQQDTRDKLASWGYDFDTMVPQRMRDSMPMQVGTNDDGSPKIAMFNMHGVVPFTIVGDDPTQGLPLLHPLLRVALEEATGINLYRGEKFQGPLSVMANREVDSNGQIVNRTERPNPIDLLLRQFMPYSMMRDYLAHGRIPTDTATLLDMVRNSPEAWAIDARGFPRRMAQPAGALSPGMGLALPRPSMLEQPTPGQQHALATDLNDQLNTLAQRHPELRERIMDEIARVVSEGPRITPQF